jgi:hypothetical protein
VITDVYRQVLCAFKVLQGGLPIEELFGIVVGHIYFFVADLYPLQSGNRLIRTPQLSFEVHEAACCARCHKC